MKCYKMDLSFDPPMATDDMKNFDYVHMTLESSSRKCLEWLADVICTSPDQDIRSSLYMYYSIEEFEVADEA